MNARLLRVRRQEAALSQRDLALRANVGVATIVRLEEGGEGQPRTIRALARALRLKPSDLQVADELDEELWVNDPEWVWDAPI